MGRKHCIFCFYICCLGSISLLSEASVGPVETTFSSMGADGTVGGVKFDNIRLATAASDPRPDGEFRRLNFISTGVEVSSTTQLASVHGYGNLAVGTSNGNFLREPIFGGYYISRSSFAYYHHDELSFESSSPLALFELKFAMRPMHEINSNLKTRSQSQVQIGNISSIGGEQGAQGTPSGSIVFSVAYTDGVLNSGQVYNDYTGEYFNYSNLAVCGETYSGPCLNKNDPFEVIYRAQLPTNIRHGINFNLAASTESNFLPGVNDEYGNAGVTVAAYFTLAPFSSSLPVKVVSKSGLDYVATAVPEASSSTMYVAGLSTVLAIGLARRKARK